MATIQIREIPQDEYDVIVRRAKANGQSIQQYMRQVVTEATSRPSKQEVLEAIEENVAKYGPLFASPEEIVAAIHDGRR
jgi:uncharacterized protein (DUF1778 family)